MGTGEYRGGTSAIRVGAWSFTRLPRGWEPLVGDGVVGPATSGFRASVIVSEEAMPGPGTLEDYVRRELAAASASLPRLSVGEPEAVRPEEPDRAYRVRLRHEDNGLTIEQIQLYVSRGGVVGLATGTAVLAAGGHQEVSVALVEELQAVIAGARYCSIADTAFRQPSQWK